MEKLKNTSPKLVGGAVAAALIIAGGSWLLLRETTDSTSVADEKQTVTVAPGVSVEIEGDAGYTIEQLPDESVSITQSHPSLTRDVVFSEPMPPEAQVLIEKKIADLQTSLRQDPTSVSEWFDLAIQYKTIGDYEGAREIWEFVGEEIPDNPVVFGNLGNLYHLYIRDFPEAEKNFRKAIGNSPQAPIGYLNLHELYKYSYKQDTTLVADVLKEGLVAIPDNINLLMALATHYRETEDFTNAEIYYEQAKVQAVLSGNENLVSVIDRMLELVSK